MKKFFTKNRKDLTKILVTTDKDNITILEKITTTKLT